MNMPWKPGADPLVDLTDASGVAAAVDARSRQHRHRQIAAESATLVGTLRDLSERGACVAVGTTSGRLHQGVVAVVARDHVVLATAAGSLVLVALASAATVRPQPHVQAPVAMGERAATRDRLLTEQCARWADEHREVAVAIRGHHDLLRGTLTAVGDDVVTVRPDAARTPVYVAAGAIEAVASAGPE
jgi:hypothetical protein